MKYNTILEDVLALTVAVAALVMLFVLTAQGAKAETLEPTEQLQTRKDVTLINSPRYVTVLCTGSSDFAILRLVDAAPMGYTVNYVKTDTRCHSLRGNVYRVNVLF